MHRHAPFGPATGRRVLSLGRRSGVVAVAFAAVVAFRTTPLAVSL